MLPQGTTGTAAVIKPWQVAPTTMQGSAPVIQAAATPGLNQGAVSVKPSVLGASAVGPSAADKAAADASAKAAAAEAARISNIRNIIAVNQEGIQKGAKTTARDVGNTYDSNTRTFLGSLQDSQDDINTSAAKNALNLRRSMSSIAAGVRQGLRSGGVLLANSNATDSGAADALARAWATTGGAQVNDARNEKALTDADLATQQGKLMRQKDDTLSGLQSYRDTEVDRISNDVLNKLKVLDAQAGTEGIKGAVDTSFRDRLIGDTIDRLNQIDQQRSARISSIRQITPEEAAAQAAQMDQAGVSTDTPFSIDQPGMQMVDSGAATSQLPIFVRRKTA